MKNLATIGRVIFSLAFIGFGINHFRRTEKIASYLPDYLPAEKFLVYFAGVIFIVFGAMILVNFKTKIASIGLAIFIVIFSAFVYAPTLMSSKMALTVYAAFVGGALFIAGKSD